MNYSKNEIRKIISMLQDEELRKRLEKEGITVVCDAKMIANASAEAGKSEFDEMPNEEIEERIKSLLMEIGFKSNCKGYYYLPKAIRYFLKSNTPWNISITKEIYPAVAKEANTTSSRVERAIRHAIQTAFEMGNLDKIQEIFGYTISYEKGKVTNAEFMTRIAEVMKMAK